MNDEEHDWKIINDAKPKQEELPAKIYKYVSIPMTCSKCEMSAIGLFRMILVDQELDNYNEEELDKEENKEKVTVKVDFE